MAGALWGAGIGRLPFARASSHCAEGATEANAGLKVARGAKVARGPGPRLGPRWPQALPPPRAAEEAQPPRLRGDEMLPKCPTFRKYLALSARISSSRETLRRSLAAPPLRTLRLLPFSISAPPPPAKVDLLCRAPALVKDKATILRLISAGKDHNTFITKCTYATLVSCSENLEMAIIYTYIHPCHAAAVLTMLWNISNSVSSSTKPGQGVKSKANETPGWRRSPAPGTFRVIPQEPACTVNAVWFSHRPPRSPFTDAGVGGPGCFSVCSEC